MTLKYYYINLFFIFKINLMRSSPLAQLVPGLADSAPWHGLQATPTLLTGCTTGLRALGDSAGSQLTAHTDGR